MNGARPWGFLAFPQWPKPLGQRPTILISGHCQFRVKRLVLWITGAGGRGVAETEWNTISGQRDRNYAG